MCLSCAALKHEPLPHIKFDFHTPWAIQVQLQVLTPSLFQKTQIVAEMWQEVFRVFSLCATLVAYTIGFKPNRT